LLSLQAVDLLTNTQVALKVYNTSAMGTLNRHQVLREISLHGSLAHENIIQLYAAFQVGRMLGFPDNFTSWFRI
jgi:serine/threonine protein kinase